VYLTMSLLQGWGTTMATGSAAALLSLVRGPADELPGEGDGSEDSTRGVTPRAVRRWDGQPGDAPTIPIGT
jgi:hypothetical protein